MVVAKSILQINKQEVNMNNKDKIHVLSRAVIVHDKKILLCKTKNLELNFYYLPGGHIEHSESAKNSLLRELKEETDTHCEIKRFLGTLEYSFEPGNNKMCHNHEYNFVFEAESKYLKSDKKTLSPEKHINLRWISISSLQEIDFRPKPLQKLIPLWLAKNSNEELMSAMI